ncbi:AAA family ATPase, partial [Thermobifida halotolerans]|uniref:AAA family ATPase n=1 Tax=Thermobifida halotolerans TaxID=483545 RepID=UPI0009FCE726
MTGPSGTGKSTVGRLLTEWLSDRYVVLEQDVLWVAGLRDASHDHRTFRSTWLRMIAMIHQSGRPVVLCGTVVPPEFEPLPERALFSEIRYLSLMCDPDVLAERLRARPAWREWDEPRIAEMLEYAEWIRANAATMSPPMSLLDTTNAPVEETAKAVCSWVTGEPRPLDRQQR